MTSNCVDFSSASFVEKMAILRQRRAAAQKSNCQKSNCMMNGGGIFGSPLLGIVAGIVTTAVTGSAKQGMDAAKLGLIAAGYPIYDNNSCNCNCNCRCNYQC